MHSTHVVLGSLISLFTALCVCACWLRWLLPTCITDTHTWADHQREMLYSNPCVYCHITKQIDFTLVRLSRNWPVNKKQRASERACVRAQKHLKDHHGVSLCVPTVGAFCCRKSSEVLYSAHFSAWTSVELASRTYHLHGESITISPLFTASSQIRARDPPRPACCLN